MKYFFYMLAVVFMIMFLYTVASHEKEMSYFFIGLISMGFYAVLDRLDKLDGLKR